MRGAALLIALVLWLLAVVVFRRPKLRFIEDIGVYLDVKSGLHVCPHCRSQKKHSLLKNEQRGFRCTVCRFYYADPKRQEPDKPQSTTRGPYSPHGWMAS